MEIEANVYICRNIMEMFNAMFLELTGDKEQGQGELEQNNHCWFLTERRHNVTECCERVY